MSLPVKEQQQLLSWECKKQYRKVSLETAQKAAAVYKISQAMLNLWIRIRAAMLTVAWKGKKKSLDYKINSVSGVSSK